MRRRCAARAVPADGQAGDTIARQSTRLWRVHACAADRADRMGGADIAPPDSRFPSRAAGTLVSLPRRVRDFLGCHS